MCDTVAMYHRSFFNMSRPTKMLQNIWLFRDGRVHRDLDKREVVKFTQQTNKLHSERNRLR